MIGCASAAHKSLGFLAACPCMIMGESTLPPMGAGGARGRYMPRHAAYHKNKTTKRESKLKKAVKKERGNAGKWTGHPKEKPP